jgi:hypothetical protein
MSGFHISFVESSFREFITAMNLLFLLVTFSALSTVLLYKAARGHNVRIASSQDLERLTKPVDLVAFRNLTDPAEETFLRGHLPARAFARVQRKRMLAAVEYVQRVAWNTAVLMRLGELASAATEPEMIQAGMQLKTAALGLRILALQAEGTLYMRAMFPNMQLQPRDLVAGYENLREQVAAVCQLQQPASLAGAMAAL